MGQPDMTTMTSGTTASTMSAPAGITVAGTRLYLVDSANSRVLIWNTIPTANGASAWAVMGQSNFTTHPFAGITATNFNATEVYGISNDGTKLYLADTGNIRILIGKTIPHQTRPPMWWRLAQPGLVSGNSLSVSASTLSYPTGVYSNGTKLYVSDQYNRVLIWNAIPVANTQAPANIVIGQNFMTTSSSGNTGTNTDWASGVACDGTKVYVTDIGNNRIRFGTPFPRQSDRRQIWSLARMLLVTLPRIAPV